MEAQVMMMILSDMCRDMLQNLSWLCYDAGGHKDTFAQQSDLVNCRRGL